MKIPNGLRIDDPASPLLQAGIVYWGVTSAAGNAGGTSIICADLVNEPQYVFYTLKLLSGPCAGQENVITNNLAGTETVGRAFTNAANAATQIVAGTIFVILSNSSVTGQILAALASGTAGPTVTPVATTIDLNQAAATYTLFTGSVQYVELVDFAIRMSGGAVAGAVTSISVQTNDATPQVIIAAANGVVANLGNEAQLTWSSGYNGMILIKPGMLIQLTITGGAAGAAKVCTVVANYRPVVAGGLLS